MERRIVAIRSDDQVRLSLSADRRHLELAASQPRAKPLADLVQRRPQLITMAEHLHRNSAQCLHRIEVVAQPLTHAIDQQIPR